MLDLGQSPAVCFTEDEDPWLAQTLLSFSDKFWRCSCISERLWPHVSYEGLYGYTI